MNSSNFYHGLLAVCIQCVLALFMLLFGEDLAIALWVGEVAAIWFYYGREVEQVECKNGRTPWWVGFNPFKWSTDNFLDVLFPVVSTMAVTIAGTLIFGGI